MARTDAQGGDGSKSGADKEALPQSQEQNSGMGGGLGRDAQDQVDSAGRQAAQPGRDADVDGDGATPFRGRKAENLLKKDQDDTYEKPDMD